MRVAFVLGVLFAVLLTAVRASDVLVFTDANFDDEIKKHEIILVEFYAPWCGHCKRLEPEYDAAAKVLKDDDPPISLAKVDCTEKGKVTCQKNGVRGYPTVKLFKRGTEIGPYKGQRKSDTIVKYMRSKAGPVSKVLESEKDVENFVGKSDPVVIGFFKQEDSNEYREFYGVASVMSEDFKFAHTFNSEVLKKYEKHTNKAVIFRPTKLKSKFEDQQVAHDGGDLKQWVKKNIHGLAGLRTQSNTAYFPTPLVTVYYNVDYALDPKGSQYWRNRVMKVAKDFSTRFTFSVASSNEFGSELGEFGLGEKEDLRVTIKDDQGRKFPMQEKFSMDTFRAFLEKFLDGKLEPYLKSEAVPSDNSGPVKVVVAKNFDEIVNDKTKDVLIEFYAPWCGHCKSLEPKYNELGEKLKEEDGVVIAKMDATANDVPAPYNVRGFPTIYFAPKDAKDSPRQYNGGREVKDFMEYLAKESTLKGFDKKGKKKDEL